MVNIFNNNKSIFGEHINNIEDFLVDIINIVKRKIVHHKKHIIYYSFSLHKTYLFTNIAIHDKKWLFTKLELYGYSSYGMFVLERRYLI